MEKTSDIIAMAKDETDAVVQVFFVREGKLIGRDHFHVTRRSRMRAQKEILTRLCEAVLFWNAVCADEELWVQTELDDAESHRLLAGH